MKFSSNKKIVIKEKKETQKHIIYQNKFCITNYKRIKTKKKQFRQQIPKHKNLLHW